MIVRSKADYDFVKHRFTPIQRKLQSKHSKAESHFNNLLRKARIPYWREKGNYRHNTRWCYYDFYIPSLRLYIELDGPEHDTEEQKAIDLQKEEIIRSKKRFIVHIKNSDALAMQSISREELLDLAAKYLAEKEGEPKQWKHKRSIMVMNINRNWDYIYNDVKDHVESLGKDFDFDRPIYLFDAWTGEVYEFACFVDVKFFTEFNWCRINEKLNGNFSYTKQNRFFLDWTIEGLAKKMSDTYERKVTITKVEDETEPQNA